ncbi:MAG: hypothetical protein ABSA69_04995 [Verrucomicrobiota bacterium]
MPKQPLLLLVLSLLPIGAGGLLVGGCATHGAGSRTDSRDNIAEYRQITFRSQHAFERASTALDQVAACGKTCPPPVVEAYKNEVEDLEVDSVEIRARAQAILTRGDAYFENWLQNVAQMKTARARALAEERHPLMLESFNKIKAKSAQTRDAFRPFLSGLRKVRSALEINPGCVATEPTRALIAATQANGRQVRQCLDAIQKELNELTTIVQPINDAARH